MSFLGHTVSWQAFHPNLSKPISSRVDAVVGNGVEFNDTKQFATSATSLVNTDVDISADRILFKVDQAAGTFLSTPGFNGLKISDHSGTINPITGVTVVSGPTSLKLGADAVFFSENAVFIDVDGLPFSRGSTVELIVTFGQPNDAGASVPVDIQSLARLYAASFGRKPDDAGLNYWIDQFENGASLEQIGRSFLLSKEFASLFGAPGSLSANELVEVLYKNILNRPGEQDGIDYWVSQISSGHISHANLLISFATSPENVALTGYTGDLARNLSGSDWIVT